MRLSSSHTLLSTYNGCLTSNRSACCMSSVCVKQPWAVEIMQCLSFPPSPLLRVARCLLKMRRTGFHSKYNTFLSISPLSTGKVDHGSEFITILSQGTLNTAIRWGRRQDLRNGLARSIFFDSMMPLWNQYS